MAIPPAPELSPFSLRVNSHPLIETFQQSPDHPLVHAMRGQLLVRGAALDDVLAFLTNEDVPTEEATTTIGAGLDLAPDDDVHVVTLRGDPRATPSVFELTERYLGQADPRQENEPAAISPNHVLIPAHIGHGCPWGPPSPVPNVPPIDPVGPFDPVSVTVIDAGYQWNDEWGPNPLETISPTLTVLQAEVLTGGGWGPSPPDLLDNNNDGILDALAGHANFVAGLIAQGCRHAEITIRNHNAGFAAAGPLPTVAAVAHSLAQSAGADVIYVGFAYAMDENPLAWIPAFLGLGPAAPGPVVVAPAGNQDDTEPRFPAALNVVFPTLFPWGSLFSNVIGVGSVDPAGLGANGAPRRSVFSNHGPWVECSAVGTNVVSTFLQVDMPLEEEKGKVYPDAVDFTPTSWAMWNGTSFAGPKVAAAIASRLGDPTNPRTSNDAWVDLVTNRGEEHPGLEVGRVFAG